MAQKQSKKKAKPKELPPQANTTEVRALTLLSISILTFLSLLSFSIDSPHNNMLGIMGQYLGGIFNALFGLGSYLICFYTAWLSWDLLFKKKIASPVRTTLYFLLMLFSFCLLLCVLTESLSTAREFLQSTFYPGLWERNSHPHLGGALFRYIYLDLPIVNFYHIFSSIGTGIIAGSVLIASLLLLAKTTPAELLEKMLRLFPKIETEITDSPPSPPIAEKESVKSPSSFMRYVKLRIPQSIFPQSSSGPNSQSQTQAQSQQHELLGIQPDVNFTERPSISSKKSANPEPAKETFSRASKAEAHTPEIPLSKPSAARPVTGNKEQRRLDAIDAQRVHNGDFKSFVVPTPNLLSNAKKIDQSSLKLDLKRQAEVLEETLLSFGIEAKVGQINCGPTINSFEVHPSIGVKVQKIKALENDIALNMEAKSIRIIAPIPGKAAVGIEIPNPQPQEVSFRDLLQAYQQSGRKFHIPVLLGKAVNGDYVMNDLTKMPHCIIAGATGSGKSVCINTIVMSILLTAKPDEIKMIMIDPKKVELTPYTRLPHMLAPVITEPHGASAALHWLVKEMEKRYDLLKTTGNRNIEAFNTRTIDKDFEESLDEEIPEKLPYIVCIVDELADLMMVSSSDIETPIARIAQMARAVGIHLILATQRPSREVITGLIKANFPTRISFKVASRINSQIILDEVGAESLLGNGDMLFLPPASSHLIRAQGAFIRDEDINAVIKHICDQAPPNYKISSFDKLGKSGRLDDEDGDTSSTYSSADTLYDQALETVQSTGNASTTFLQRKLKIGYARAASLMDELEKNGIVGMPDGSKARKVLVHNLASKLSKDEDAPEDEDSAAKVFNDAIED
ncbi:MAG: DNA translocase FtsK [Parachlamydiaceae bacterium]|nr:DNA translocase FtsK [Parachlamydiaceae bacterium]